jgi:hypothetical protein
MIDAVAVIIFLIYVCLIAFVVATGENVVNDENIDDEEEIED